MKKPEISPPMDAFVAAEFQRLGLNPPCTPEDLASMIERACSCTIAFQPHSTFDPYVYGMVCREPGSSHYCILFRPSDDPLVEARTKYHELGHIYLKHELKPIDARYGLLRGYMVSDSDDAQAEEFAAAATFYSLGISDLAALPSNEKPESLYAQFLSGPFSRFLTRRRAR